MDTSPDYSGSHVKPKIVRNYDGGDIVLNGEEGVFLSPTVYPELLSYVGKDLITTDGSTLLGADDKAGVAEIMALADYLQKHPEIPHGDIRIGFTPDEEVGCGANLFDVAGFGADVAYTVDGGELGELEYENFNAASANVIFHGSSIHPGSSKGKMKNAILMAMEFQQMLPVFENPMYTFVQLFCFLFYLLYKTSMSEIRCDYAKDKVRNSYGFQQYYVYFLFSSGIFGSVFHRARIPSKWHPVYGQPVLLFLWGTGPAVLFSADSPFCRRKLFCG